MPISVNTPKASRTPESPVDRLGLDLPAAIPHIAPCHAVTLSLCPHRCRRVRLIGRGR
jgi:hypothetical protein